jgi:enoyl-CoA hydratase/carnithine racemase
MGLLDKIVGKDLNAFAKQLAEAIAKRYPPALDQSPQRRVSPNRVTRVLEDALEQAIEFTKGQRLGVFRKARLANAFKWELKELGYSDKFIEIATEGLVVYVTRGGKDPAAGPAQGK